MIDPSRRNSCLERLSVERLEELLDLAVNTDEEEDAEYVDALLKMIVEKEKENPTGRLTDVNKAWADFQTYYNTEDGRGQAQYFTEEPEAAAETAPVKRKTLKKIWKSALLAAAAVSCLLFCVVAARAAGFNFLYALGHWTDDAFSFGNVQPGAVDYPADKTEDDQKQTPSESKGVIHVSEELPYSSFQEALDAYEITEVSEPSYLPSGYVLDCISRFDGTQLFSLDADYKKGEDFLSISIYSYSDRPSMQVEKTDDPVETFEAGNRTFYLMRNTNNYSVAWLTEHYECLILAPLSVEPDELKDIVYSMFDKKRVTTLKTSQTLSYSSLQDALDEYSITEISEPTYLPEGYELDRIRGGNLQRFTLDARYTNGKDFLTISIISYNDNPNLQVERTDDPVESFEAGNRTFYLMRNTNNYSVAWLTEHYECLIMAPLSVEPDELKDIVYSMFDRT